VVIVSAEFVQLIVDGLYCCKTSGAVHSVQTSSTDKHSLGIRCQERSPHTSDVGDLVVVHCAHVFVQRRGTLRHGLVVCCSLMLAPTFVYCDRCCCHCPTKSFGIVQHSSPCGYRLVFCFIVRTRQSTACGSLVFVSAADDAVWSTRSVELCVGVLCAAMC